MINASEKQLWSGLTHLEISFREERERGEWWEGGRRRCFYYIPCQINKSSEPLLGSNGALEKRKN